MADRSGSFGLGTPGIVVAAVAGIAVLGLAGREVYQRAQLPLVSVEEPAENPSASQPPQAGVSAGQGASGETVPTNAADAPETADSADNPDTAAPDMAPGMDPPSFDVVRVDPDGTTVIAGTGPAGAEVTLHVDDAATETTLVNSSGEFVAFPALGTSDRPRLLTLLARRDGQEVWSEDSIILAPMSTASAAPSAAAESVPAATGEPAVTAVAADAATGAVVPAGAGGADPAGTDIPAVSPAAMSDAPSGPGAPEPAATPTPPNGEGDAPRIAALGDGPAAADTSADPAADPGPAPRPGQEASPADPDAPDAPDAPATEPADFAAPDAQAAPGGVAVLRAGADGVDLLQPGTPQRPDALDRLSLDTISYSEEGEVLLAGRAPDGTAVRVYVDNEPVADLPIGGDGRWRGEVPGIRPGVHTLRLDQIAADGAVGGRLETPFKREAASVLAAARSDLPADSAAIAAVTVQRGDTLWAISQDRYGSGFLYVRVFEANRDSIRDPDLIYPGQVFAIPN